MATYEYDPNNCSADADDLSFDFDMSDVKSDADLEPGGGKLPAGRYVAFLRSIENEQIGDIPAVMLVFVVKSGPLKGKKHNEHLFMTERAKPRVILFAKRFDLMNKGDCEQTNLRKSCQRLARMSLSRFVKMNI